MMLKQETTKRLLTLLQAILPFLVAPYTIYGAILIDRKFFDNNLSEPAFAGVVAAVFLSGYPVFAWKRRSIWRWVGRWSLAKWIGFAAVVGLISLLTGVLARLVTNSFSNP